jgi:hypothetical protein
MFKCWAALLVVLAIAMPARAGLHTAEANADSTITVSGSWSSMQWCNCPGSYSGAGDPQVYDWDDQTTYVDPPMSVDTSHSDAPLHRTSA